MTTNIILCGLQCSGKTSVGLIIAKKLNWTVIDTDQLIEARGITCRQIVKEHGENYFRTLESEEILRLQVRHCVISLGGGALLSEKNRSALKTLGSIVYLKAPENILWERIQARGIPSYLDPANPRSSFLQLVQMRIPIFESSAHFVIDTEGLKEIEVADRLLKEVCHGK